MTDEAIVAGHLIFLVMYHEQKICPYFQVEGDAQEYPLHL